MVSLQGLLAEIAGGSVTLEGVDDTAARSSELGRIRPGMQTTFLNPPFTSQYRRAA